MNELEQRELLALRKFAAGNFATKDLMAELGPLSLWSKDALEREIAEAAYTEREACAKLCESRMTLSQSGHPYPAAWDDALKRAAEEIRLRGNLLRDREV